MDILIKEKSNIFFKKEKLKKDPQIEVTIRSFCKEDVIEIANFMTKAQLERHPFYIQLNWTNDYLYNFFLEYLPIFLPQEMSLVALIDSKIIGFIAAMDYFIEIPEYKKILNKYKDIEILDKPIWIEELKLKEFDKKNKEKSKAFISTLAVDIEYNGKGIGGLLFEFINYHPKLNKYDCYLTHIASFPSKIIAERLGFINLKRVKYEELINDDGEFPFKGLNKKLEEKKLGEEYQYYYFLFLEKKISYISFIF